MLLLGLRRSSTYNKVSTIMTIGLFPSLFDTVENIIVSFSLCRLGHEVYIMAELIEIIVCCIDVVSV